MDGGEPGLTNESFEVLKLHVKLQKETVYCNLFFDEMAIRKPIECDGKKFRGYVEVGICGQISKMTQCQLQLR